MLDPKRKSGGLAKDGSWQARKEKTPPRYLEMAAISIGIAFGDWTSCSQ
jgi:hypothetical protein